MLSPENRGQPQQLYINQLIQSGTTNSGNFGNQPNSVTQNANVNPGKRKQNPLSSFASYTYNLSLYMVSPDAYDAFILSGRTNINALRDNTENATNTFLNAPNVGGAYLIAQSGGINNKAEIRAEGFDLDYYIDNLRIKTITNGKDSLTATNNTEITFRITEPYGFSFISNLKRAQDELQKLSKTKNYSKLLNPTRQFYILGIRFYGYDINGNIVTKDPSIISGSIDQTENSKGVFERFYDILISEITFKIEGRAVVYNIKAAPIAPNTAFTIKRGRVDTITKITAATVEEAISQEYPNSLLSKINAEQEKLVNAGKISIPNKYLIRFLGPEQNANDRFRDLRTATIVLKSDLDKSKMPAGTEDNSNKATDATSAKSSPDITKREITFNSDTSIMAAIEQIIKQSSYLTDALKVVQKSTEQPNPEKNTQDVIENRQPTNLKWYNLSSEISNAKWDEKLGDFAYTITYVIQPYETPVITAAYLNDRGSRYYGPHKRYEYWYTGKNSEILQYEQTFNNNYFHVALDPGVGGNAAKGAGANIPLIYKPKANASQLGKLGAGNQAQNAVVTSLFDPGAYVTAKIKILGDPDFLMQESPGSINQVYNQFYGTNGFTVNPNGGQVFIEINFKEPQDYNNNNGLLNINESILFWKYPKKIQKDIDSRGGGVSYMVTTVTSTFENGRFIQDIDAIINTFPDDNSAQNETGSTRESSDANARSRNGTTLGSGSTKEGNSTTTNTGFIQDDPFNYQSGIDPIPQPSDEIPNNGAFE